MPSGTRLPSLYCPPGSKYDFYVLLTLTCPSNPAAPSTLHSPSNPHLHDSACPHVPAHGFQTPQPGQTLKTELHSNKTNLLFWFFSPCGVSQSPTLPWDFPPSPVEFSVLRNPSVLETQAIIPPNFSTVIELLAFLFFFHVLSE